MTTTSTETTSLELGHYVAVLRRRAGLVVLCTLVGLLAGLAYLMFADRQVTATTTVNVNVISTDPFSNNRSAADLLDAESEQQYAASSAVLRKVAEEMAEPASLSTLRGNLDATLIGDATVMRVAYTSDERAEAEQLADAVAEAYLAFRNEQAQNRVAASIEQLNQRRDQLREDLLRLNTIIRDANPGSNRAVQAETDRQLVNIELDRLSGQISTFLGLDTTGGSILTSAGQNPVAVAPSRALALGTGTALGLLVGLVAAFVRHKADRRIRDGFDMRGAGGGQVLGELPGSEGTIPAGERDADAIRSVRELLFAKLDSRAPVVAVADVTPKGGGGDVAANLAAAFAETGRAVELVLADTDQQVADAVAASMPLDRVPVGAGGAYAGAALTVSAPGRGTVALQPVEAGREGVLTVVSVPHDAAHSTLLAAGRLGHAVVLVASTGGTEKEHVRSTVEELAVVGARVHGTVLVSRKRRAAPQLVRR